MADTYVFSFPPGQSVFYDINGIAHVPDANGMVAITDIGLVKNFLNADFSLLSTPAAISHDYATGHADWTLSTAENAAEVITVTGADAAANAIAVPTNGKILIVYNNSGQTVTVKAAGQTGVAIANAATIILRGNGTDFVAVSSAATALNGVVVGGTTPAAGTFTTLSFSATTSASHDYAAAHADWTLSAAEGRARSFVTTNAAGGGANAILPAGFVGVFMVSNTSGQTVTWKYAASTGIANATAKKQILVADGVEVYSLKADY